MSTTGSAAHVTAWTGAPGSRLTNLTRHPEFAIVRAGAELGTGLRWFNHKLHLLKVDDKVEKGDARFKIKGCEACHERSSVAPAFNPISFARHCATCHEEDLSESAGTLPAAIVAALGPLPRPLQTRSDPDDPGRQAIVGLKHADPWVLRIVNGLRGTADPEGVAAERLTLESPGGSARIDARFAWTRPSRGVDRSRSHVADPRRSAAAERVGLARGSPARHHPGSGVVCERDWRTGGTGWSRAGAGELRRASEASGSSRGRR